MCEHKITVQQTLGEDQRDYIKLTLSLTVNGLRDPLLKHELMVKEDFPWANLGDTIHSRAVAAESSIKLATQLVRP